MPVGFVRVGGGQGLGGAGESQVLLGLVVAWSRPGRVHGVCVWLL